MPQLVLPMFPDGVTEITPQLAVGKDKGWVTYFHGAMPVFTHAEDDLRSFRLITAQFCCNGNAKQADIVRAFGVSKLMVLRAVKLFRAKGACGFFEPRRTRGPVVLTPAVLEESQSLLDDGLAVGDVAEQLNVKPDTMSKAVRAGRLHVPKKNSRAKATVSTG